MREGRKVTMGRYSRKQTACAGKESAEDFGKRREDQREISAHLQLNYANTPPCGCAGVTFFSLIRPLHEPFIGFLLSGLPICITPCNSITQIPTRLDTGGVLFYSLLFVHCTNLYWLPIIWITPFNPIMQIPPCRCVGSIVCFFSPSAGILYIFFYFHYTETLGGFRSYQLPKTI